MLDEVRVQGQRHRHLRLAEEIGNELRRIVTAGIFEVEEGEAACVVGQRIVKAEVRRRQATIVSGEHRVGCKSRRCGARHDPRFHGSPGRLKLRRHETPRLGGVRRGRIQRC